MCDGERRATVGKVAWKKRRELRDELWWRKEAEIVALAEV